VRGYVNLSATLGDLGHLDRGLEAASEGSRLAERFGLVGQVRFLRGNLANAYYRRGEWDEAARYTDEGIGAADPRRPHYSEVLMHSVRGRLRLARGEISAAAEDAGRSLELARSSRDPQSLLPSVALMARVQCERSCTDEAGALVEEALRVFAEISFASTNIFFSTDLLVALHMLGRADEFLSIAYRAPMKSPWFDAASAFASGAFERAADVYAEIGALPDEAYARLRAAEQLLGEGRRAEADKHLGRALGFWRSVGATRFIREGESLLAATA
jgi:tetratricopeptide (TPR) repeat protein